MNTSLRSLNDDKDELLEVMCEDPVSERFIPAHIVESEIRSQHRTGENYAGVRSLKIKSSKQLEHLEATDEILHRSPSRSEEELVWFIQERERLGMEVEDLKAQMLGLQIESRRKIEAMMLETEHAKAKLETVQSQLEQTSQRDQANEQVRILRSSVERISND
jgi:hypothetical protein